MSKNKHNITPEILLNNGYVKFPATLKDPCVKYGYQKVVKNNNFKLYFINVYFWSWSSFYPEMNHPNEYGVEVEVMFYKENDVEFEINYRVSIETTIEMVEDFYAHTYKLLNCIPDRHNND